MDGGWFQLRRRPSQNIHPAEYHRQALTHKNLWLNATNIPFELLLPAVIFEALVWWWGFLGGWGVGFSLELTSPPRWSKHPLRLGAVVYSVGLGGWESPRVEVHGPLAVGTVWLFFWAPKMKKNQTLMAFSTNVCRHSCARKVPDWWQHMKRSCALRTYRTSFGDLGHEKLIEKSHALNPCRCTEATSGLELSGFHESLAVSWGAHGRDLTCANEGSVGWGKVLPNNGRVQVSIVKFCGAPSCSWSLGHKGFFVAFLASSFGVELWSRNVLH